MSTIAYIGNFEVPFSTESHVALSLESLGVRVIRVQEDKANWLHLPALAAEERCEFVLWTHTHARAPEELHGACRIYLHRMREAGIPTVGYHLDRWWGLDRAEQVYEPFFQQDIVCTADGGHQDEWEMVGVNHHWFPPGVVHTEVGRGKAQTRYHKEVGFLGGWMNYGHRALWPWRYEMVIALNQRYRQRFRAWPRGGEPIRGMEINSLYASVRCMVGDSCLAPDPNGRPVTRYWSDRVPESLGRGAMFVHPYVEGLREEFPTALPLLFEVGDRDSMFAAVDTALGMSDRLRESLTNEAIEYVRAHHTYQVRMQTLFDLVEKWKAEQ